MKLKGKELKEIVFNCHKDWQLVKGTKEIVDQSRWSTYNSAIFQHISSGKWYQIDWNHGSTEIQDEGPFEFELEEEFELTEVIQKEVTKLEWVPV